MSKWYLFFYVYSTIINMNKKHIKNVLFLLATAVIWGIAFVSQRSAATSSMGAFTFNGIRYLMGGIALIPAVFVFRSIDKKKGVYKDLSLEDYKAYNINTVKYGLVSGFILIVASILQQKGVEGMSSGKAGFITALYIIFTPIFGVFFHRKPSSIIWIAAPLAIIGMFMLCMVGESFVFTKYEVFVLLCSFAFTAHILYLSYITPKCDVIKLCCIQYLFAGTLSSIAMFIFETPSIEVIKDCIPQLLYSGLMSAGLGYTFNALGQRNFSPTIAAMILCLESPISAIAGWVILKESLSLVQWLGCLVMLIAIIIAQIPANNNKQKENKE